MERTRRKEESQKLRRLLRRIEALQRTAYYHLARIYRDNDSWIIAAWPIEELLENTSPILEGKLAKAVEQLRQNLYMYMASLGAEWHEEENIVVLRGSFVEAGKTLKALWLSLHLAQLTPANTEPQPPSIEELYTLLNSYTHIYTTVTKRYKPIPFILADKLLDLAAYTAMTIGVVEPSTPLQLGVHVVIADMLYALTKTL